MISWWGHYDHAGQPEWSGSFWSSIGWGTVSSSYCDRYYGCKSWTNSAIDGQQAPGVSMGFLDWHED